MSLISINFLLPFWFKLLPFQNQTVATSFDGFIFNVAVVLFISIAWINLYCHLDLLSKATICVLFIKFIYKKFLFFIHYVGHKGDININLYLMLISKTILKWCGHCNLFVFLFYIGESILLAKVFSICSKCSVFVWVHPAFAGYVFYIF